MNMIFRINAPFLNLKIRWAPRKRNMPIMGNRAGYNIMLSATLPFSNSIMDR